MLGRAVCHNPILLNQPCEVKHKIIHTIKSGLYKRFAYAISVRSSGHRGGRWDFGMLSREVIHTCLEVSFARMLRKALLTHDTRSRSIGWMKANICKHQRTSSCVPSPETGLIPGLTSYMISKGIPG